MRERRRNCAWLRVRFRRFGVLVRAAGALLLVYGVR